MKSVWPLVLVGGGAALLLATLAKSSSAAPLTPPIPPAPVPPKPVTPSPPVVITPPAAGEPVEPIIPASPVTHTAVVDDRQYLVLRYMAGDDSLRVQTDDGEEWIEIVDDALSGDSLDQERFQQMMADIAEEPEAFGLTEAEQLALLQGAMGV